MANLIAMKTEGRQILIEAEVSKAKLEEIGVKEEIIKQIQGSFKSIAETIKICSQDLAEIFDEQRPISKSLKGAEIEFGIKVSGEGNVYVVKTTGEANISVKLNWEFNQEK
jgi:hypothetical protein